MSTPLDDADTRPRLNADELPPPPRRPLTAAAVAGSLLAGYDVGAEIGRGGMGVVYRARDRKLGRDVAVKLVLAGSYADSDARERFLTEARVTARLQHPNIVQIFEVGDAGGVPYTVLELVEGGSLAQVAAGAPLPGRAAAALVETLARAVAYAHARGVVHRDLKPGNILIAGRDDQSARRQSPDSRLPIFPKITDFGLAKQLDDDSRRTRSGVIVGTPSYMAPEQVAGGNLVGPAVDVYALGAILYELLTGRPPFHAAIAYETLDLVRTRPPVAPAVLQPGLARDLNTVCLKCLEKDPARRYPSADALAQDLHRFLDGRPILARPVGPAERTWRWARRNPRVATLLVGLAATLIAGGSGVFWQWRRAEKNFAAAEKERDTARTERAIAQQRLQDLQRAVENMRYLIGVIDNDQLFHLRMLPPRKELLEPALRANQAFLAEHSADPNRDSEVASAHYRVAILTRLVGTRQEALAAGRQALEVQRKFVETHPSVTQYRRDLAACYHNVGFLIYQGQTAADSAEALTYLRHARLLREEFADAQPENLDYLSELAGCLNDIGLAYKSLGQHIQADEVLAQAIEHQGRALDRAPHVQRYRILLGNHLYNRARCRVEMKHFGEAVRLAGHLPDLERDEAEAYVRYARIVATALEAQGDSPTAAGNDLLDRAVRAMQRAAELSWDYTRPWLSWGELKPLRARAEFRVLAERAAADQDDRLANAPRQ